MDDEEIVSKKISDYNSAELLNMALANEWAKARDSMFTGNFPAWKARLDVIWGELAGDTDEGDADEKKWAELETELSKTGRLITLKSKGFNEEIDREDIKLREKQYRLLRNMHIWLKRLQNAKGKGSKYRQDMDDYFD